MAQHHLVHVLRELDLCYFTGLIRRDDCVDALECASGGINTKGGGVNCVAELVYESKGVGCNIGGEIIASVDLCHTTKVGSKYAIAVVIAVRCGGEDTWVGIGCCGDGFG